MILTIDIGNTLTKFGLFYDSNIEPEYIWSINTDKNPDSRNLVNIFTRAMQDYNIDIADIEIASISTVVESGKAAWIEFFTQLGIKFVFCDSDNLSRISKDLYSCAYAKPEEVGGDIIATCIAANYLNLAPCAIIDFGTATNINVVNKNHALEGAIICSGLKTTLDSITNKASALPKINIEVPGKLIGNSTVELIQSGAVFGEAARADGLIDYINDEYSIKHNVICTGGFSKLISPLLKHKNQHMPNLILLGLKAFVQ